MNDTAGTQDIGLETWINQLKDEKVANREEALNRLGKLKDPAAIPAILQVLQTDKNLNLRRDAAVALGKIGHSSAVGPLLEALAAGGQEKFIRLEIIQALHEIGRPEAVAPLGRLLSEDDDRQVHFAVMSALAGIGGPQAIEELQKAMLNARRSPNLRAEIIVKLGELKATAAAADIQEVLKSDEHENVDRAAVSALAKILEEDSVPILAEVLREHPYAKVQKRAVEALGDLASLRAIEPLCLALLENRNAELTTAVVEALHKITDWKAKTGSFISLLQGGEYHRSNLLSREIISALNPTAEVLGENPFTLTDYLIENCIDKDARMTANLAALIIASTAGDLALAGDRINKYASKKGISEKSLDKLRIEIGGETALDPVLRMLSNDLRVYFREPIKELNEKTLDSWNKTIRYGQWGFLARMIMSVVVFVVGIALLTVSAYQFIFGQLDTARFLGAGISFVSGIGTMLLIIYTGPLREIRDAVDDLGTASAAFIAYVHRVSQISHTFSFHYIKEKINFEEMKKSSDLIEDALKDTIDTLARGDKRTSEELIQKALEALKIEKPKENAGQPGGEGEPKKQGASAGTKDKPSNIGRK